MKSSKILILVFTLSFPVILYLFLTFYGSNEFDLPVYFETENEFCEDFQKLENVADTLSGIDQSTFLLSEIFKDNINIVHFPDLNEDNQQLKNELSRLLLTFSNEDDVKLHALYSNQASNSLDYLVQEQNASNYTMKSSLYNKLIDCYVALPTQKWGNEHPAEMVLNENATLVLIDQNAQIRGYYDGLETKDVDRLILEIRILMTKQSE